MYETTAHNSTTVTISIPLPVSIDTIYDLFRNAVRLRKGLKLTQKELGKMIGFSQSSVSTTENNPEFITMEYWYKFAELFGLQMGVPKFGFMK